MNRIAHRRAFTLVELLAVIAIIGLLIALLIPAVQSARESGRRSVCLNNSRQIATAFQTHHSLLGAFPPGQRHPPGVFLCMDGGTAPAGCGTRIERRARITWMQWISPYMELMPVYDDAMTVDQNNNQWLFNRTSGTQRHPAFMCPSDPNAGKISYWNVAANGQTSTSIRGFCGNYMACASSGTLQTTQNGVVPSVLGGRGVNAASVIDGLSATLLLGECIVVPDPPTFCDMRGAYFNSMNGETQFTTLQPPNTTAPDGSDWLAPPLMAPPMAPAGASPYVHYSRSMHPGGVNVALADGSTRFVANDVAANVWQAAGSRNGREVTGLPE